MKVALFTARPIGQAIFEMVNYTSGVEIVQRNHVGKGWWGYGDDYNWVNDHRPDLIISCMTNHIFKEEVDECPIINFHPAPLPEYRGCNGVSHAIMNGDEWFGVTAHYVDRGIDTGDIINSSWFTVMEHETARGLYERAQAFLLMQFADLWPELAVGKLPEGYPQDEERATYYKRSSLDVYKRALDFPPFQVIA